MPSEKQPAGGVVPNWRHATSCVGVYRDACQSGRGSPRGPAFGTVRDIERTGNRILHSQASGYIPIPFRLTRIDLQNRAILHWILEESKPANSSIHPHPPYRKKPQRGSPNPNQASQSPAKLCGSHILYIVTELWSHTPTLNS